MSRPVRRPSSSAMESLSCCKGGDTSSDAMARHRCPLGLTPIVVNDNIYRPRNNKAPDDRPGAIREASMLPFARAAALVVVISSTPALAEMNGTLRIGVLNDMSSVYADF